jgi:hypothetical protein
MAGAQPGHGEPMGMCPMQVQGTQVRTEDTEGGVSVVFTTSGGDVADLRARVRRMAEMHTRMSEMHAGQPGSAGPMEHGMQHGMGGMAMVPSTATASDIEGGARIELRPHDPAQLEALRSQAHTHVQQMASSGQCPMMGEHGAAHAHR